MPPTPVLPPELWDYILDFLCDERPTLAQCALTSRDWLPRVRHLLFRSVYIDWSNCYPFSRLLEASPSLAPHVSTLEIEGAFGIFSMDRLHGATLDAWLRAIPPSFSAQMTGLSKLELALITIDLELAHRVFSLFSRITHLTLWACALTSFQVFVDLLSAYPRLTTLSIAYTSEWETCARPLPQLPPDTALPALETIELTSACDNFKVLRWLISQGLHTSIHTLACSRVPWPSLPILADALRALAPTLRTLRVGFGDNASAASSEGGSGGRAHPLALAPLPALTSLTLDVHTNRLAAVPYTLFLLAHLPAPALRTLTFAVRCGAGPGSYGYSYSVWGCDGDADADADGDGDGEADGDADADKERERERDTGLPVPWKRLAEAAARVARVSRMSGGARGPALERVVVCVRERDADAPEGSGGGGAAPMFPARTYDAVDFAATERAARAAFAAQGIEKLLTFVHRD